MSNVRPLRPDDPENAAMAVPRVNARFLAEIGNVTFTDTGVKVVLSLPESTPPEVIFSIARAKRDGTNAVVLISRNTAQVIPGTEDPTDIGMAAKVARALELHEVLCEELLRDRDPSTGYIESDGPNAKEAPLFPVGTQIGETTEHAAEAVATAAADDKGSTARAAGRALGRSRRRVGG